MAGPVVHDPAPTLRAPSFGTASAKDLPAFLGVMQVLHSEPTASAYGRLLVGETEGSDVAGLVHVFEEISTLAIHGLISEDLLFDAFALDLYYDQLNDQVDDIRKRSGNAKFAENFEVAAGLARSYRTQRPRK